MGAGKLIASFGFALLSCAAIAADVVLPTSGEDYRELAESIESTPVDGRRGVVERVTPVHASRQGESPMKSPALRESADIMSDRPLIATPVVGVGVEAKIDDARGVAKTVFAVVIRWDDGTIGVVNRDRDPLLKKGDAIVMKDGRIERIR